MPKDFFTTWVIPGCGIIILAFCLLSYFFPYGDKFKDKTQKIEALGMKLEVSVLVLFVLIGLAMSLSGFYEHDINILKAQIETDKSTIERLTNTTITVDATLDGINSDSQMPKPNEINCYYYITDQKVEAVVTTSPSGRALAIHFDHVNPEVTIRSLFVEDKNPEHRRVWFKDNYRPLRPQVFLDSKGAVE